MGGRDEIVASADGRASSDDRAPGHFRRKRSIHPPMTEASWFPSGLVGLWWLVVVDVATRQATEVTVNTSFSFQFVSRGVLLR